MPKLSLAVGGLKSRLLRPRGAGANEDVDRAAITGGADVVACGSDEDGVSFDGHRLTESIGRRAIRGGQRGLEGPAAARPLVDVNGTLVDVDADVIEIGRDDHGVAVDGDGLTELIARRAGRMHNLHRR
jgi:hypothetical protein